jgi:hypothetical protein
MTTVAELLCNIEQQKHAVEQRIAALQPWRPNGHSDPPDLPLEATLGTMWMRSDTGSTLEFYSWIDPAYCHGPMYEVEEVHMTQVTFHKLAKYDRAFLKRCDDFTIYDIESFHRLIAALQRAGFQIMLDPLEREEKREEKREQKRVDAHRNSRTAHGSAGVNFGNANPGFS